MSESGFLDGLRRVVFQRSFERRTCTHLDAIDRTVAETDRCTGCERERTQTVHLRMCLTCGEVGCCDSSPAKHARRHHDASSHPLIMSIEPGEHWLWCYPDRAYLAGLPD